MSHAKRLFTAVLGTFTSMRQVGSTAVLGIAARNSGLLIVAGTLDDAKRICHSEGVTGQCITSLSEIEHGRLEGRRQPIALDNYALLKLCEVALGQFDKDALDIQRINNEWHKQNLEYEGKLQHQHSQLYKANDLLHAKDIQLAAYEQELLGLKIKLNVRKVTHIRVTRKRRK